MGQTCLHRFDLIIGYHSIITYISQSDIVLLEHDIRTTICNRYVTEFDTKRLLGKFSRREFRAYIYAMNMNI